MHPYKALIALQEWTLEAQGLSLEANCLKAAASERQRYHLGSANVKYIK